MPSTTPESRGFSAAAAPPAVEVVPCIRELRVRGIRLRYLYQPCTAAAVGGPPLILLHGLLGYSFCWRRNIAALAGYADVYVPDLPGMGFSDRPTDFQPTLTAFARVVLEFCDALKLGAFDLAGTSHGAAVAMLAAANDGQRRARKLVLNAPVNPWSWGNRRRIALLATPAGALALRACYPLLLRTGKRFLRQLYADPRRMPQDSFAGYCSALRLPGTAAFLLRTMPTWQTDLADVTQALPKIADIPTLLLWGAADTAIDPASATRLSRSFHHATVQIIPHSGHMPYEETPEEFNKAVTDFLYRNPCSG